MHVFEFLESNDVPQGPLYVLVGSDRFLQQMAWERLEHLLGGADRLAGGSIEWRDLADRLHTRSLFDQGAARVVLVDDADSFVTAHRERLEAYCSNPS